MMVLDCQFFIPKTQSQRGFILKEKLKESYALRYIACYNSFYFHELKLNRLLSGEMYEADLLQDSYLRSIVLSALQAHRKETDTFAALFLTGTILYLLGDKKS
ncbi:MAG: hypothetical protein GW748_01170 [Alphaproteobacteria bacterium]|nr:hypothetical protein [Alphaproteobacteria bacterium]NCQ66344.1 hypothetical protein [Alphaproteobacteria bacterium]NCT06830.1 hypothetical protein [Alphaproteobacteria bacterium]